MKTHKALMIAMAVLAVLLVIFAPALGIGRGIGLLLLICPLMMLAMMDVMGKNHKQ